MSHKSNRRDPRVNIALSVKLLTTRGMETHETKNISYRGIFIITDQPLPLRRVTRLEMEVGGKLVTMLGMVAHRINVADATERRIAPGMGIQIFSVGSAAKDAWQDYVTQLVEQDPELLRALQEHNLPKFKVNLSTPELLKKFVERDLPQGQIYYRTPEPIAPGSELILEISHPTSTEKFNLKGQVREITEGARRHRGMYVELAPMDEELFAAFERFVHASETISI